MEPYIGEIQLFCGNYAPEGWAFCEGQLLSTSEYGALFAIIGTVYGGDGKTTFALPDLRGRAPLGLGNPSYPLGSVTGVNSVYLTMNHMPPHKHTVTAKLKATSVPAERGNPNDSYWAPAGDNEYATSSPNVSMAADMATLELSNNPSNPSPIDNYQPLVAINFIIALEGTYPQPPQ